MSAGYVTELAIAGMAVATYLTRVSGLYLMRFMKVEGRNLPRAHIRRLSG